VEDDFDKAEWQARQAQLEEAVKKQREKDKRSRERSARKAQRKLECLKTQLGEKDDLSDWEKEFSESVSERLDKYGTAFNDLEKGRSGEALSFSQKRVISQMRKKLKDPKKGKSKGFKNTGFKRKNSAAFKPRVRHIEDELAPSNSDETLKGGAPEDKQAPLQSEQKKSQKQIKPFLRLVKNETQTKN